jgi:exopolyphosphatase/guanosine-5'-triphosphate,3'-diphosphate pyrophosphatase
MRIAAIDCGTNSLHLIIAQMDDEGRYDILHDLKEMPRLGEGVITSGVLSEAAMNRALQTLVEFAHICERFGVQRTRAVATSAVRRAANGAEFVERVHQETRIPLVIIDGEEEARLVSQAVLAEPGFTDGRFMIYNVGGGSTEFAWGRNRTIKKMLTLPMGAVTLTEEFLKNDPPRSAEVRALYQFVTRALRTELPRMEKKFTLYGTGGTVSTLVGINQILRFGVSVDSVFYPISDADTREIYLTLLEKDLAQRRELPGLKGPRADIICGGMAVVKGIMEVMGQKGMLASSHGLKYGLLTDEARQVKRQLLLELLEKQGESSSSPEIVHVAHVRELAFQMFDALKPLHQMGGPERELLRLAALLHDVGQTVDFRRHHKHSYRLIRESHIGDLTDHQRELVALIARYHRKAHPRMRHPAYAALTRDDRRRVKVLSAILRLAIGFDRSHSQAIQRIDGEVRPHEIVLTPRSTRISTLDQIGADSRRGLLEEALGRPVRIVGLESEFFDD